MVCLSLLFLFLVPLLLGIAAVISTVFTLKLIVGQGQYMSDCELKAFKLIDEMLQATAPKGLVERIAKEASGVVDRPLQGNTDSQKQK
ncbi:hypothetical protein QR680_012757 [Steinernema hermaphroditum]|uniref:Uncharacterized protein n=1 Tax=Steinernema hermaphroditum TaxID=289476 RepID=A0AA39I341_9BILA|nr:hypothetical protein QR680_012757 [Steinernema hermaphroditum]